MITFPVKWHDDFTYSYKSSPQEDSRNQPPDTWVSCCFITHVCLQMSCRPSRWRRSALACSHGADATCVNVLGHDPNNRRLKQKKQSTKESRENTYFWIQVQRATHCTFVSWWYKWITLTWEFNIQAWPVWNSNGRKKLLAGQHHQGSSLTLIKHIMLSTHLCDFN